jgi:N-acyl-D-aspartate/D-glutamate deacylase
MHDLVITGGVLVDGLGAAPVSADVAVDGGRISAVGSGLGDAREVIDARGRIVTPGFVDLHTHFDAQIGWDSALTPVSQHGVTTALIGNCGMGFAPVRADAHESIAKMMEAVEDIPAKAILSGLPWSWESYGEYLDVLAARAPVINVAGMVGHVPVRAYAMGDGAVGGDPTTEERALMARLVADARGAGAVGFSTSRHLGHMLRDGRHVPGTFAGFDELRDLVTAVGEAGIFQAVINEQNFRAELELVKAVARASGAKVVMIVAVGDRPSSGETVARIVEEVRSEGVDLTGTIGPRSGGVLVGLLGSLLPWRTPQWGQLHRATLDARLAALRDDVTRKSLIAEADAAAPFMPATQFFPLGAGVPDYTTETSLAELAAAAGESIAEYFVRVSLETEGSALFAGRQFNHSLDAIGNALANPHVLPGLGDAGAHVGQTMDAGWTTFWLTHWVRDTKTFSLEEGVRRITSAPADLIGLDDVGRVVAGARADLNVIELDALAQAPVTFVHDFPHGAGRFTQGATGYAATVVNGVVVARDDELTGASGGRVVRA